MGSHNATPRSGAAKPAGITPTILNGRRSSITVCPIAFGSAPKRRIRNRGEDYDRIGGRWVTPRC